MVRMGFLNINIREMHVVNIGEEYFTEIIAGLQPDNKMSYFKIFKTCDNMVCKNFLYYAQ